jgi:hypothetical protein
MATEKVKIKSKAQIKSWTYPHIKNHKKSYEFKIDQTTHMT